MKTCIKNCRSCGSSNIEAVFDLGEQMLSGVFRSANLDDIISGPLTLVRCDNCQLVQLQHSYPLDEMYNEGYGYRSGLTAYMSQHLKKILDFAIEKISLKKGDYVLDIGSNDGTLLHQYSDDMYHRIGIDPVAKKYLDLYPKDAKVVTDFFTKESYFSVASERAKVVTSISMFYDLEKPVEFAKAIASVLSFDGVWVFEQSYLPAMLRTNSYDTICHEHLEYYSLTAIQYILQQAGMTIIDASQNEVNGGSIRLAAVHESGPFADKISSEATWLIEQEKNHDIYSKNSFESFQENVQRQKLDLVRLLQELKKSGKTVIGYGASTKGNVILQYCGIGPDLLPFIGDITPFKDGVFTPGSKIPVISMEKAKALKPDYFLVLPWAFRSDILLREKETIYNGTKFIFPLPFVEIVS
ncbi:MULTISPECIES: class I SAM-dependent methyltransferase [Comamonadaceae]|uniref:class I SAM-dependent methyltransferase n=1 Tax=Comamonadaceae TaxID=80864 RepID=UPI002728912D|nr:MULTISPECIES: class I SAM-dependent methyltransferase [Comamonadaceae]MDO9145892.1 class I SAM-dependent methyltransferase [Rhodoferax sp.]MDP3887633.1 class I SAM-dependent methyltransferase [Hydrogenophaga sp.]